MPSRGVYYYAATTALHINKKGIIMTRVMDRHLQHRLLRALRKAKRKDAYQRTTGKLVTGIWILLGVMTIATAVCLLETTKGLFVFGSTGTFIVASITLTVAAFVTWFWGSLWLWFNGRQRASVLNLIVACLLGVEGVMIVRYFLELA